jgi:hypothetical protein
MQPAATTSPAKTTPPLARRPKRARNFFLIVILLAIAFGAGYVPQWIELRRMRAEQERLELDLRLINLHRRLGLASHEAQRNNFASAAEHARLFFDECVATVPHIAAEPRTSVALAAYASQRDEIMALLAAADPASRERLAGLYFAMDGVLARRGSAES